MSKSEATLSPETPTENGAQPPVRLLTKDAIFAQVKLASETMHIPEWNGSVIVRELDGNAREAYDQRMIQWKNGKPEMRVHEARIILVMLGVVDSEGRRMFSGDVDAHELRKQPSQLLERIADKVRKLSGIRADEEEAEGKPVGAPTRAGEESTGLP